MISPLFYSRIILKAFICFTIFSSSSNFFSPPTVSAGITLDGSLGPQKTLSGPDFVIDAGDGKLIDQTRLFHSFGRFDINAGESATFTGPETIDSIIGRVTGGNKSSINGALNSEIPGADLFLINPAGFIFGPGASLDVQGSFHVSTADYLRLEGDDNGIFYADLNRDSILTVAAPAAFGFLTDHPAEISVDRSILHVPVGSNLSMVGGDIEVTGSEASVDGFLLAPGGRINIASVSSTGEAWLNAPGMDDPYLDVGAFATLGNINFSKAYIDAGGDGGGTIIIRGGQLALDNSYVYASTKGPVGSSPPGIGIDIQSTDNVSLENYSDIATNVSHGVPDDSGGVRITADHLQLSSSWIQCNAFSGSTTIPASSGNTGDIEINTKSLLVKNRGGLYNGTGGSGDSGDIYIKTGTLEVVDGGYVFSSAFGGTGNGGDIVVQADHILLSNENTPYNATGVLTQTYWPGTGKAGNVSISANSLNMYPATEISSATFYLGQAGNVQVAIDGNVYIEGSKELLSNGNPINTGIFNNTFWYANGGNLDFSAETLEMTTAAGIQVVTLSYGNAGIASLDVGDLYINDASYISSNGFYGTGGNAGGVIIEADNIVIAGPENSDDPFGADATGISTTSGIPGGIGGNIAIMTDTLSLTNRSIITSISRGPGDGGDINIDAESVEVLNGAQINAGAAGTGNGGVIDIDSGSVVVSGVHPDMYYDALNDSTTLAISAIASQTLQYGGNGGKILINADSLELKDSGRLTTETYGAGNAGNVEISTDQVLISGADPVLEDFLAGPEVDSQYAGAGIYVNTDGFLIGDLATGNGGYIDINTDVLKITDRGQISGTSSTPGLGGSLKVAARNIELNNKALISLASFSEGDAGDIYLGASDSFSMRNSAVSTESVMADGGNIKVDSQYLVHLVNSEITASVGGGEDTIGGNISIDPEYVVLKDSRIIANAYAGKGGNIDIVANVYLTDPNSLVDASSALGIDGDVDIQAPTTVVSESIAPLAEEFRSVVSLLREPCIARLKGGEYSSFVIDGRDGLPRQPGSVLPSPMLFK